MTPASPRPLVFALVLACGWGLAACGQSSAGGGPGDGLDAVFGLDLGGMGDGGKPKDAGVVVDGAPSDGKLYDGSPTEGVGADESAGAGGDETTTGGQSDASADADESSGTCDFPANPAPGEPGSPCEKATDCDSGLCVPASGGATKGGESKKICTVQCVDCCPGGFTCAKYGASPGNQGGVASACLPAGAALCTPCSEDWTCNASAGSGALCVKYGDTGSFCGLACGSTGDCPAGYGCVLSQGEKGAGKQCVLQQGECACTESATDAGAQTQCQVSTSAGTCTGVRKCGPLGLNPCPAATPEPEACDGLDNDCDGATDEANPGVAPLGCKTYFYDGDQDGNGKAEGNSDCLCAPAGLFTALTATDCNDKDGSISTASVEICDGLDNDCDGTTDEGCDDDVDGYCDSTMTTLGNPVSCTKGAGDCDDTDVSVHPNVLEQCGNAVDDDCDGLTDSGPKVSACVPFYKDGDGDGYGTGASVCECGQVPGFTATKTGDCNDAAAGIHPGLAEVCGNAVDENCSGQSDEPDAEGCADRFVDADGDGFGVGAAVCLCTAVTVYSAEQGGDCDDAAVAIHPDATETCNQKDDDCDAQTDELDAAGCTIWYVDGDGDGFGATATALCLCQKSAISAVSQGGDCDDNAALVYPGAVESCNATDDDCDAQTDEEGAADCQKVYPDGDGDGFGVGNVSVCLCAPTDDFPATIKGDCDDLDSAISPAKTETCDGVDNNCVEGADEADADGCTVYYADKDEDGYGDPDNSQCLCAPTGWYTALADGDCNDGNKKLHPKQSEVCDGVDNDCDGQTDPVNSDGCNNWYVDGDGDGFGTFALPAKCLCLGAPGYAVKGADCGDDDPDVHPNTTEVCNGKDDDCDGATDPLGADACVLYFADVDQDGFGASGLVQCACGAAGDYSALVGGDCADALLDVHPGVAEACNALDDDCNGATDEDLTKAYYTDVDKDGWGVGVGVVSCGPVGDRTAVKPGDCDDAAATTYPGAKELCDGVDNNCNVVVDDGATLTKYYLDADGDGYGTGGGQVVCGATGLYAATVDGDCDDGLASVHPGANEVCNSLDDDCNGQTDENLPTASYFVDKDGDGYGGGAAVVSCGGSGNAVVGGDCNDADTAVHPNAVEICDGVDNDCSGEIDQGLAKTTYYVDSDGDGYGSGGGVSLCTPKAPISALQAGDCNDSQSSVNPGKAEVCGNGVDEDCSGAADEGCVVAVCAEKIIDDFESASDPGWTFGYGWGKSAWAAVTGGGGLGFGNSAVYPSQADATVNLVVPMYSTSLEFDYVAAPDTWELCGLDHLQMWVDGKRWTNTGPCSPYSYLKTHYTLTGFGSSNWGTTITVLFRVTSDVLDNYGLFKVDNLKWGCK